MEVATLTRKFTPEEYFTVLDRLEIRIELVDGQIMPKEGIDPLPVWVVEELLKPDFNTDILSYEFPVATTKHDRIIMNLVFALNKELGDQEYELFANAPKVYISLKGTYRLPDVTVAPAPDAQLYEEDCLTNPLVVIEVLSPSNAGKEFEEKLREYKSVETIQEYWLIHQDEVRAMQFVRQTAKQWLQRDYDLEDEILEFPTLKLSLGTKIVYRHTELV
ncbi:MAG: Uma2 family endonuclease [Bacteroidota bacterium]